MMVDTLTIARELRATDLPTRQAEAIAAAIGRSVTEAGATAATVGATIVALLQAQGLAQATAAHPRPRQDRLP